MAGYERTADDAGTGEEERDSGRDHRCRVEAPRDPRDGPRARARPGDQQRRPQQRVAGKEPTANLAGRTARVLCPCVANEHRDGQRRRRPAQREDDEGVGGDDRGQCQQGQRLGSGVATLALLADQVARAVGGDDEADDPDEQEQQHVHETELHECRVVRSVQAAWGDHGDHGDGSGRDEEPRRRAGEQVPVHRTQNT